MANHSTVYCNPDHKEVKRLVQQLQEEQKDGVQDGDEFPAADDDVEFVKAAYNWVRDEIKFEFMADWTFGVETIMAMRKGNCFNKACVLNALLRARGLKTEFLWARIPVRSKMIWRMAPDWAWKHLPSDTSPHLVSRVYLQGRWIVLDPSIDAKLANGMSRFGNSSPSKISFNGKDHAVNPIFLQEDPIHQCADADFLLTKKPAYKADVVALMEASTHFLRTFASSFETPEDLGQALQQYLLYHCPQIVASSSAESTLTTSRFSDEEVTEFCHSQHAKIQKLAHKLRHRRKSNQALTDVEYAVRAFQWVRDNIMYTLQTDWTVPVHYTLDIRRGACSTKACLLTSLLRAGGLRAGFFFQPQNARKAFLAPPWITRHYKRNSVHFLSAVYLHNKWIPLDPFVDRYLGQSMDEASLALDRVSFVVDFDGYNPAVSNGDTTAIQYLDNIDCFMRKKSRIPSAVIECHNICLEVLRKFGSMLNGEEEVLQAMEHHLITFYTPLVSKVVSTTPSNHKNNLGMAAGAFANLHLSTRRSKL